MRKKVKRNINKIDDQASRNYAKLLLMRQSQHEEDLRIQELRRLWEYLDPVKIWEQTEEEIEFGIFPEIPKEPEDISRFDLLDVEE